MGLVEELDIKFKEYVTRKLTFISFGPGCSKSV